MDVSRAGADDQRPHQAGGRLVHVESLPPRVPRVASASDGDLADALTEFVSAGRPWREQPVALTNRTTMALWSLAGTGGGVCVVMVALLRSSATCHNLLCALATLGGRPLLTLVLAAVGTTALITIATLTRGLTRVGARELWLLVPAAFVTAGSVAGAVIALVVTVAIALILILAVCLVFAFIADRS